MYNYKRKYAVPLLNGRLLDEVAVLAPVARDEGDLALPAEFHCRHGDLQLVERGHCDDIGVALYEHAFLQRKQKTDTQQTTKHGHTVRGQVKFQWPYCQTRKISELFLE